jgi:hypothetical protein
MTFLELTADLPTMKEGNAGEFIDLSDEEITELCQISAKVELKKDILLALNLDQNDSTILDDVVDLNSFTLSLALAYLQCRIYYQEHNEILDASLSLYRLEQYTKMYNAMKGQFNILKRFSLEVQKSKMGSFVYG